VGSATFGCPSGIGANDCVYVSGGAGALCESDAGGNVVLEYILVGLQEYAGTIDRGTSSPILNYW
jgi:hypothetical protein